MKFEDWEPYYISILSDFDFERFEDENAAKVLSGLTERDDVPLLDSLCRGHEVTICGNAPCLKDELGVISGTVIAADAAADFLYTHGIRPDVVFTDLDGATDSFYEMSKKGTLMVIHAHGDNIPLLRNWVPRFEGPVIATTQARPFGHVHNFGGFSDGDRAIFAAEEFQASSVRIVGFDLDDRDVDPVKRGKLMWARTLLKAIGHEV